MTARRPTKRPTENAIRFETLENRRVFAALPGIEGAIGDDPAPTDEGVQVGQASPGEAPSGFAFDPAFTGGVRVGFTGGVYVSAGDFDAQSGGGVIVGQPTDGSFQGGVRVAVGDVDAASQSTLGFNESFTGGVRVGFTGGVMVGSAQADGDDGILIASSPQAKDEVFRQLGSTP